MKNLKLGDIVEYKVENEPYILAYCGACFYSLIQLDASGRFVALSTPRVARIQPIVGMINASLTNVRLSSKSVQLCFNKQEFLDEVFGLLEDMYYDDGDDVDIHVYTVGNCT